MKGIILAGGTGSRLQPMTLVTNKHLLPVYNKPMIYYPLYTLINSGIKDIMVITGKEHAGAIFELLGSGKDFGVKFTYRLQDGAGGIAQALGLCEDFADGENVIVVLGDNVFEDNLKEYVNLFEKRENDCILFLKEVSDPQRFGVAQIDENGRIISIEEKPEKPKSNFAVTGIYIYDSKVFEQIKTLKPSGRGELEITDVNNWYVNQGKTKAILLNGFWSDAGTVDSLYKSSEFLRKLNTS